MNQLEMIRAFSESRPEHRARYERHIQLVNNLTVVHARESFADHADPTHRRYLLRLWLSSPIGRKLPEFLSERWGNIAVGSHRGGIMVPGVQPMVNFDPPGMSA